MSAGISVFSELSDASRLTVLVSGDPEHPLNYGIKLKGCGEYHLLLTVDGKLFLGEHRIRDKAIEFWFLRDDVADFDTEGNWVYLVSKLEGKVYQAKNGSFEQWSQLFEESEIRFEQICCNNNGLLVTSSSELYAEGDFGSLLNYEELAPVKEIASENVVQITAGIDFVILSSRKTAKVMVDVKKDPYYDRYCLHEDGRYTDWKNIYRDLTVRFERPPVESEIINNVNVDSVTVYGQMIHETGVASFGKVNKGESLASDFCFTYLLFDKKNYNLLLGTSLCLLFACGTAISLGF